MKNCKTLHEVQTASHLKEVIQSPPNLHPSDKTLLRLWNKNFLTEIYRNIKTFAIKVLQECGSWESRNGAVQIFFLTPKRNMCAPKIAKSERFSAVLLEHINFNVKCVEVRLKRVIFFTSFFFGLETSRRSEN